MLRVGQNCLYIYTVYDRIFGDFPAQNTVYTPYTCIVLANPAHIQWPDRSTKKTT